MTQIRPLVFTLTFSEARSANTSRSKYTVWYEGYLFEGDSDGFNEHGYDRWEDAIALYNTYGDMIHIKDNEYDVTFEYGEWN